MIGVYVIIDPAACVDPEGGARRDPRVVCRAALRGGASRVQLRTKGIDDRERLALARDLARLCRDAWVPFVMNDRVDLALLAGASEVHLGQSDLEPEDARRLAPRLTIGRSTHDLEQVVRARGDDVDRIAFGPVFPTHTKPDAEAVVGVERLARVVAEAARPVVAIGGIDVVRAPQLKGSGIAEIAVISAVCGAVDPEAATARLREALA